MSELPKGWKSTELESLLSFVLGGDWGKAPDFSEEGYLDAFCIRGTEFKHWKKDKGITSVQRKLKASSLENRTLQLNDILIEISGGGPDQPVGRTVLIDKEALKVNSTYPKVCTNFIRLARPSCQVYAPYLNYYLHSFYLSGEVTKYQGGSNNLRNLKFKEYSKIEILVPPYNEQIRIANKLDSILAKVDKAQARLDKIPAILKRFRQSVLAAATSGELNGPNVTSDDWTSVKLMDVVETKPRNGKSPKGVDFDTGVKNLTLSAITPGYFVENKFKFVDLDVPSDSHLWVKNQDILIQRANSIEYVGVSALYEGEDDQYIYPDLIMKCRANERILSKYLYYALSSESVRKYFRDNATGTTGNMPKINQTVVSAAPISLPPLAEQEDIVSLVEKLFRKADTVEKQYLDAKARLDRLTQSILAKAFRGGLVPQDPTDEPAEKLLERIWAEKEQSKPKKTTRKRTTKAKTAEKE
ncbi:TPA: restriction endonuclease subunit S [Vibrio vulnificus]